MKLCTLASIFSKNLLNSTFVASICLFISICKLIVAPSGPAITCKLLNFRAKTGVLHLPSSAIEQ